MAEKITKKPSLTVTKLATPSRKSGTRKMEATWKIPANLVSTNKKDRAEGLEIDWFLGLPGKDPKKVKTTSNERATKSTINLNSLKIGKKTYTRDSFYPKGKVLSYVTVQVIAKNKKGKGKAVKATRTFALPKAPTIDDYSFNNETGEVSTTIRTDPGEGHAERYDTKYTMTVYFSATEETIVHADTSTTETDKSVSYDVVGYQALSYDDYVKIEVKAFSRGYAGDSDKTATKSYYVSYPAQTTITGVDISSRDSTGKCTVSVETNHSDAHPVDRIKLEYLANVEYAEAGAIPGDTTWTETNIVDDKDSTALACPVTDLIPDKGKYTWIRVKSWHANEDVLYRYSEYKRLEDLETPAPTATDDKIDIISAMAGRDGRSAVVHLGWNADGQDDSNKTELTWSEEEDTWKSTKNPDEYEFEWSDGPVYQKTADEDIVAGKTYYTRSGEGTEESPYVYTAVANPVVADLDLYYEMQYHDSALITIKGLDEATQYFIRARRVYEGDTTTYSDYSNTATCLTSERPESIVADAERYISTGGSLNVRWTFSGNGMQRAWQIVKRVPSGQEWKDDVVVASGEGSIGSTQISAERLSAFADNGSLSFNVQVNTGSGWVVSENKTVTIFDNPTLSVDAPTELTVQPYSFDVEVSSLCDLIVIVTSQGAVGQFPQGVLRQASGDTIHSAVYSPEWDTSGGTISTTVEIPSGLDFWDLGKYTLSVVAVDRTTGLKSAEVLSDFSIAWANQAVDPEDAVTLTVIDTYDEDGDHTQAVQIDLTPPTGSAETDVYDIYRMDVEKPSLIGEGFPLTHTVIDEYAPFGDDVPLFYRVALRTVDGDVEVADIPYEAQCEHMRFDWSGGSLELPYGLMYGETFTKDVDIRKHLDGSTDGYWNNNIERKSSLASDVIKIVQLRDIERARNLARYAGPVFVRLPNGAAFEADVQVTDLSKKNDAVVAMAFDATEVGLTDEFILPIPFDLEEEEESE